MLKDFIKVKFVLRKGHVFVDANNIYCIIPAIIYIILFIYSNVLVEIIRHKVYTQNVYYLKNKKENERKYFVLLIRGIIKRHKNILVLIVSKKFKYFWANKCFK